MPLKSRSIYSNQIGKRKTSFSTVVSEFPGKSIKHIKASTKPIIQVADLAMPKVQAALLRTVLSVRAAVDVSALEDQVVHQSMGGVLNVLDLKKRFDASAKGAGIKPEYDTLVGVIQNTFHEGAKVAVIQLNKVPVTKANPYHDAEGKFSSADESSRKVSITHISTRIDHETDKELATHISHYNIKLSDQQKLGLEVMHPESDSSYLQVDIYPYDMHGHPSYKESDKIPIGIKGVKEVLLRLQHDYPSAKSIEGVRITGMGRGHIGRVAISQSAETTREELINWLVDNWVEEIAKAKLSPKPKGVGASMAFDMLNPKAVEHLQSYTFDLIEGLTTQSQLAIQDALINAFQEGGSPANIAKEIISQIGLTQKQVLAVKNFKSMLKSGNSTEMRQALTRSLRDARSDKTVLQAIADKKPLPKAIAQKMVDKYASRSLAARAESIARTETIRASNIGQQAAWQEAKDQGFLSDDARQQWIPNDDELLCEICSGIPDLNEDGVRLDESFDSEIGELDGPPAHPHCRCSVALVSV